MWFGPVEKGLIVFATLLLCMCWLAAWVLEGPPCPRCARPLSWSRGLRAWRCEACNYATQGRFR